MPLQELVERGEDAAARAGAVAGRDPLRASRRAASTAAPRPSSRPVSAPSSTLTQARSSVSARVSGGAPAARSLPRRVARDDAVVVERHLDRARLGGLERQSEERLGVLGVEVAAAETVDAGQATESRCPGSSFSADLTSCEMLRAVAAVGVGALADHDGPHAAQRLLDLLGGERADHVRADHAGAHALLAQACRRRPSRSPRRS